LAQEESMISKYTDPRLQIYQPQKFIANQASKSYSTNNSLPSNSFASSSSSNQMSAYKRPRSASVVYNSHFTRAKQKEELKYVDITSYDKIHNTTTPRVAGSGLILDTGPNTDTGTNNSNSRFDRGCCVVLNRIAQGTDVTERIGRKIHIEQIHLNYVLKGSYDDLDGTVTNTLNQRALVRVMLVQHISANSTEIKPSNVITGTGVTPLDFMDMSERRNYKILYNQVHAMGPQNAVESSEVTGQIHKSLHLRFKEPIEVLYGNTNTGDNVIAADGIMQNALWLMAWTDIGRSFTLNDASEVSKGVIMDFRCRLRFSDQ